MNSPTGQPKPTAPATPAANGSPPAAVDAPASPSSWIARYAVHLAVAILAVGVAVYFLKGQDDPRGILIAIIKVAVGLGAIIFVHELGHFLAAKWCDVHVQTFSIGFGPPLLGLCSFKRGETTYKIAWFPLGGYVKMLGEGDGNEETDDDPRSFKNKSVWRRMIIISAGVIMNLIMAAGCFVAVYMTRGISEVPAVVGHTEPGGPAWQKGIRPGSVVSQIGSRQSPFYEDLQREVSNSAKGQPLQLVYDSYVDGKAEHHETGIVPARTDSFPLPMIGIRSASIPVVISKDRAVAFSKDKEKTPYFPETPAAKTQPRFQFGDKIVAATNPDNPTELTPLAADPRKPGSGQLDYFDLRRRLHRLMDKPITLRVQHENGSSEDIMVPPAAGVNLGLRMRMGEVVAVRENSPAAQAGLRVKDGTTPGDIIQAIEVTFADGTTVRYSDNPTAGEEPLDPVRLPTQLSMWAGRGPKSYQVKLTVQRPEGHNGQAKAVVKLDWDRDWELYDDPPGMPDSPLTLAGLGIAYRVQAVIAAVEPDSPASGTPLKAGDVIKAVEVKVQPPTGKVQSEDYKVKEDQWACFGAILHRSSNASEVVLTVGEDKISLKPRLDESWPMFERGLYLDPEARIRKADGVIDALQLGIHRVFVKTATMYENLLSLVRGRISPKAMTGPIGIAKGSFRVAMSDDYDFILLLALININLAIVNFLPIPILDGGHMVFLVYEWIRGKPPTDTVRLVLTLVGLGVILALFVFTSFLDILRETGG